MPHFSFALVEAMPIEAEVVWAAERLPFLLLP